MRRIQVLRRDTTQRIDHHFSSSNRLMGRLIENLDNYVTAGSFPQLERPRQRWNVHMVIEDTHVFSPTLVNTFRVGLYQEKVTDGLSLYGVTPMKGDSAVQELGIQGVNPHDRRDPGDHRDLRPPTAEDDHRHRSEAHAADHLAGPAVQRPGAA
jgi:hypothetical protein